MITADRSASFSYTQAIAPAANRTATQTSAAIDLSDCTWAQVICDYGAITDGNFAPSITDSATSGGSYVANTTAIVGTVTVGTSSTDDQVVAFDIDPAKADRYVKVVLTASGTTIGGEFAVTVAKSLRTKS